jgi:hypothetical protein
MQNSLPCFDIRHYRPWTIEDVPVGAQLGVWRSKLFCGRTLILGVYQFPPAKEEDVPIFHIEFVMPGMQVITSILPEALLGVYGIEYNYRWRKSYLDVWLPCGKDIHS